MDTKKIVLSTFLVWIAGTAFGWLTCGWLFTWVYEIPPLIWHSEEKMISTPNIILGLLFGILSAFLFTLVYAYLHKKLSGKGVKKGMKYGFGVWLLSSLSGLISMPLYMTIAPAVVAYWIIQSLIALQISGAIVGKVFKK